MSVLHLQLLYQELPFGGSWLFITLCLIQMRKYTYYILLLVGLFNGFQLAAQVDAIDTSRTIFLMLSGDATSFRETHAALERQTRSSDKTGMAESYYNLGSLYRNHSIVAHSLKYFLAAAQLAKETGSKERLGWCYMALGGFYKNGDSSSKALYYLSEGEKIFSELNNKHGLGSIYNGYGDVYEHLGDYSKAHHYYFASLNILRDGEQKDLLWPYFNIGEVYMLTNRLDSARLYYDSALIVQIAAGDKSGESWIYNNISSLFIKKKDYTKAEKYCFLSYAIADSLGEQGGLMNACKNLYIIYEAREQYEQALKYYKKYNELAVLVNNEANTRKIIQHQMQYDFDSQKQIDKAEQVKKDVRNIAIAIVLILAVMIATIGFYFQHRSNKLKAALLSQKELALTQKEMMMKEIHHRVKNNLQVTGTLLDLQLANIQEPKAKEAIKESIARLNTISLIHNQLYTNEQTSTLDFSFFATELHRQLNNLYGQPGQHITWQNQMSHLILDIDTAVPLGLIINELITNSYKHAFNEGENWIKLTIKKDKGYYHFAYADSGRGLPGDVDLKKSKGLGMMIIHSLSKQIGGSFEYDRSNNTFVVTFKDAAEMKRTA